MKLVIKHGNCTTRGNFRSYVDIADYLDTDKNFIGADIFIFTGYGLPKRVTFDGSSTFIEGRGYV